MCALHPLLGPTAAAAAIRLEIKKEGGAGQPIIPVAELVKLAEPSSPSKALAKAH